MSALLQDPVDLEKERLGSPPPAQNDQLAGAVVLMPDGSLASSSPGYSGIAEHSTPAHAFLEHSTSILFPVLFGTNVYFSFDRLYELKLLWLAALAIPLAFVLGDFVGGLVHWAADTYFSEDTPVVGPALVKPFRQHHIFPRDICTHTLVSIVGNVCILAVPVLALCLFLLWVSQHGLLAFAILGTSLMAAATVATNVFHKWAHQERPSAGVRWLQRLRLVLEPRHHQLHHTEPFERHYCITNGWLNPLLNKIRFFRKLEAILRFLGIETNASKRLAKNSCDNPRM
ncbi:MAG: fatty acid desaturase family protein [Acidobacteria bacterium]|nr:fatty acid desaturase family protein [Acidobacteriota bacterium]